MKLYTDNNIYTKEELLARANIHMETYNATIEIEARTMIDMIAHEILPAASADATELCERAASKGEAGVKSGYETKLAKQLADLTDQLAACNEKLAKDMDTIPADPEKAMAYIQRTILGDMAKARGLADQLEAGIDEEYWPFPTYSELLFSE